ncbi:DUF1289 domain-containing protein [Aquabacterium fontiphilum]|uniref:DUF1289 domain-containing protein n=1 Tax=Aquabacterium fontiphilum TaxID=450365 RepID=UPI0013768D8C|nr:DUF1289 domain-containing protein [Aquabacterium fontiphilum]NBD19060.1 DUF1289 domain-containing protein [Aquabacterium fontiphilum]
MPSRPPRVVALSTGGAAPGTTPSPCRRLCTLNVDDVCVGCGRMLADITRWTQMTEPEKQACVAAAQVRLDALRSRRV